ncbi:MAG: NAD(P)H-dependent oxidoreductase subunit E [Gammaproteobacteria bacterium]|uniref:NAD(P)H-dependent oxidoreductase subunit E n=1 Tax=Rhodoferax sp. TaxID=50421 RepID=UPI00179CB8F8|nr:NAD(P)H-dependent oxidoreductase subunit E [Rhodoferax sp.]MBU3900525.1 NAD(P)H-dependent oxidoreductase subunit E [Gammaproteobacteria bacterium]MBA3057570.1 NADP oxidoreductase [Rhodoferax sp.]MBU3996430.1 NAD(P)H-dependent oxidoreductase subunit E [Gammaproteobacteria bacterium]MBU4079970.1 NAD(P)H-dependent oxidoreductase subunit E [Gammaproteobacteria bacterium]MBU4113426.1 NAD(P)H-dependent oxidoreductase subunit E [Gammaproteobacteria bacterium]
MLANCITSRIPADTAPQLQRLLVHYQHDPHALLQILREWQGSQGWLSPDAMSQIASALGLTLAQVQGVAGFYRFLHTQPVGVYRVLFSDNVTDRMLGAEALLVDLCQRLGVLPGQVSSDGLVSVDLASCTGLCDQGPALLINHTQVITRLDAARVAEMAKLILARVPVAQWPPEWFEVQDNIRRADLLLGNSCAPGAALAAALARGADATLAEIKQSNLRGRGGAGFATGRKLELCRQALGAEHVVVCNADEGEPGTFKDRVLLTRRADTMFEGMTIAAQVLGARRGLVYLRGEYRYLMESLQAVLQRRREQQLLGANILGHHGFDFDIAIHVGAGAYVCGEESALIESLEGKRGAPRIRPPFPAEHGYLGHPTVVYNVETFCAVAHIAQHGGAAWAAIGTAKSTGTKIHSVSGDCERPGLYEYPLGTRVSQILADCGARNTQAVQIGGPSGVCLASDEFERRIAFEDVPTAGAFMVFDRSRDMFEVARGFAHFFAHESCGFCTPCRVGTALLVKRMDKLAAGRGSNDDLDVLFELDRLLHSTTHCGLGASACNPLRDTVLKFRPAYEKRLQSLKFEPGFDLDAELSIARHMTGRDDAGAHL